MNFTVLNWNIGGAKFLEEKTRKEREETRTKINKALIKILTDRSMGPQPDVVTLQEIVRYQEPIKDDQVKDILDKVPGYCYFPFTLIDSNSLSSKAKWNKIKKDSDWDNDTYFAQGNAFLIKNDSPHFPVWDLSDTKQSRPGKCSDHFIEKVHLDSGLYFGDRNTEPRAALVSHFIFDPGDIQESGMNNKHIPLDIFVVNVHLTTLMMEREGVPEIDMLATEIRKDQLNTIFNGIVSRYNSWRQKKYPERGEKITRNPPETTERHSPIWIIAGDFNFTEESAEYAFIKRLNFIDTVSEPGKTSKWGCGTKAKGVGVDPTLTLDYIFAGPKFVSLDPAISLHTNRIIYDHNIRASDHYPVLSSMTLFPL
ncbi:MAG: endonuclease/exonuclease/phosphatase family protein [Bacteroidia bacterium]|nr:endonuclease/exonuclease/phosphatase family protein [Bacteroidia bacterium]